MSRTVPKDPNPLLESRVPTRIVYGLDAIRRLPALAREFGGKRVLLVSDAGLVSTGLPARAMNLLRESDLEVFLFEGFGENPNSKIVEDGSQAAREHAVDFLIGFGGGSSMDCAKAINFVFTNGGTIRDYWGYGRARRPMLPMIAVPTTAGTGSEVQSYAIITDEKTQIKMACGDPKAAFRAAILDPKLTISQPPHVTAATGYDAIAHAVETYVTTRRNIVSQFFSLEALKLLERNLQTVIRDPGDLEARGAMLLGACWAGTAIENSMLGATHALANPLSERYDTTHGVAIAMLLHHVVRWNAERVGELYLGLARECGLETAESLADRLQALLEASGLPVRLRDAGARFEDFPALARRATEQWTGTFNPRPLSESEAIALYEKAY